MARITKTNFDNTKSAAALADKIPDLPENDKTRAAFAELRDRRYNVINPQAPKHVHMHAVYGFGVCFNFLLREQATGYVNQHVRWLAFTEYNWFKAARLADALSVRIAPFRSKRVLRAKLNTSEEIVQADSAIPEVKAWLDECEKLLREQNLISTEPQSRATPAALELAELRQRISTLAAEVAELRKAITELQTPKQSTV